MSHYRGYFMKNDHIVAPHTIEAADDAEAVLKASELLSASHFYRIEVWQEARVLGALSAPSPSHEFVGTIDKDSLRQRKPRRTSSSSEVGSPNHRCCVNPLDAA